MLALALPLTRRLAFALALRSLIILPLQADALRDTFPALEPLPLLLPLPDTVPQKGSSEPRILEARRHDHWEERVKSRADLSTYVLVIHSNAQKGNAKGKFKLLSAFLAPTWPAFGSSLASFAGLALAAALAFPLAFPAATALPTPTAPQHLLGINLRDQRLVQRWLVALVAGVQRILSGLE